jgi:hypothetical protein
VTPGDHHTEYLARAVAALTPEGRRRAGELLAQLLDAAAGDEPVVRFATDRKTEVDLGRTVVPTSQPPEAWPDARDVDRLMAGFTAIRDQEPLDDVADWANAVVALLEDSPGPEA